MGIESYREFGFTEAYAVARVFELVTAERMFFRIEILRAPTGEYSARYHRRAALKGGAARDGESLAVWVETPATYVSATDEETAIVQAMGWAAKWSKEHGASAS